MFTEPKEIIVVVPSQYEKIGRGFAHEISKQPNCKAAFWTIEQYNLSFATPAQLHDVIAAMHYDAKRCGYALTSGGVPGMGGKQTRSVYHATILN